METLDCIGNVLPAGVGRDAVHIAVYPMVADRRMNPGHRLDHGIVDPFLSRPVERGERFYLFLTPQTIQSLRHVWIHPGLPDETSTDTSAAASVEVSMKWLDDFARNLGPFTAMDVIEATRYELNPANKYGQSGSICMSHDLYSYDVDPTEEFWRHYAVVTGEIVPADRPTSFRCAC